MTTSEDGGIEMCPGASKVSYRLEDGGTATAYLDECLHDVRVGQDKHTEQDLIVRWDGEAAEWVLVEVTGPGVLDDDAPYMPRR
jgi:hypothetical protein